MVFPRPLDKFVWVERTTDDGVTKQQRIPRSQLSSLSPHWKRIADPTKKQAEAEPAEEASRPAQSDNKDAWVAYAATQGLAREEAESSTKADLVELFKDQEPATPDSEKE